MISLPWMVVIKYTYTTDPKLLQGWHGKAKSRQNTATKVWPNLREDFASQHCESNLIAIIFPNIAI